MKTTPRYRITRRHLRGACKGQLAVFRKTWPKGAIVSLATLRRAGKLGLDLSWFADKFLSASAFRAFDAARTPAVQAYRVAEGSAWRAYTETAALEAYSAATASARQVYEAAEALALWKVIKGHGLLRVKPC